MSRQDGNELANQTPQFSDSLQVSRDAAKRRSAYRNEQVMDYTGKMISAKTKNNP